MMRYMRLKKSRERTSKSAASLFDDPASRSSTFPVLMNKDILWQGCKRGLTRIIILSFHESYGLCEGHDDHLIQTRQLRSRTNGVMVD